MIFAPGVSISLHYNKIDVCEEEKMTLFYEAMAGQQLYVCLLAVFRCLLRYAVMPKFAKNSFEDRSGLVSANASDLMPYKRFIANGICMGICSNMS